MENYRKFLLEITLKHMNRVGKTDFRVDWGRVLTEYQKYYDDKRNNTEIRASVYSFYTLKQLKEMKAEQLGLKLESPEEKPKAPEVKKKDVITRNSDGSMLYEKLIKLHENEINDDEIVLKAFSLDPRKWTITSATFNLWSVDSKEKRLNNYQAKIKVKPKELTEMGVSDLIEAFNEIIEFEPLKHTTNFTNKTYGVYITDTHIGSSVFDDREYLQAVDEMETTIELEKPEAIKINFMGDILDVDNTNETTVKGTQLKLSMTPFEMMRKAESIVIHTIKKLSKVPTDVYWVQGNHSRGLEYLLFRLVERSFKKSKHITFHVDESLRKAYKVYETFIGLHHGEMPKQNYFKIFQFEFSDIWGKCDLWETHSGHFHSKEVEMFGGQMHTRHGVKIRKSNYEDLQGYDDTWRVIEAVLYEKGRGRSKTFIY